MKDGVYSRGILPGSRNAAPGDATGRPGDQEPAGGLGESVGDTAQRGGTGVAHVVGGGTAGTRAGGRNRAPRPIKWRHASLTHQTRVTHPLRSRHAPPMSQPADPGPLAVAPRFTSMMRSTTDPTAIGRPIRRSRKMTSS